MTLAHYALTHTQYGTEASYLEDAYKYDVDSFMDTVANLREYGELDDVLPAETLAKIHDTEEGLTLEEVLALEEKARNAFVKKWLDAPRLDDIITVDIDAVNELLRTHKKDDEDYCILDPYSYGTSPDLRNGEITAKDWESWLDFCFRQQDDFVAFAFYDEYGESTDMVLSLNYDGTLDDFYKALY